MRENPNDVFLRLGATMYTPANHPSLLSIWSGSKYPQLRSSVACTEDSIHLADLEGALTSLRLTLNEVEESSKLYRFVRVRNPEVMSRILAMPGVHKLHGFVIPKCTAANIRAYLGLLSQRDDFLLMPIIETEEAFRLHLLRALRKVLSSEAVKWRVPGVRIGVQDLMGTVGVLRAPDTTIYQTFLQRTIIDIVTTFKPHGFGVAGPVFEVLRADGVLRCETKSDLNHGLFGKSVIHPDHIQTVENEYGVTPAELEMAVEITGPEALPVFQLNGTMCEVATHLGWARTIIERSKIYGLRSPV